MAKTRSHSANTHKLILIDHDGTLCESNISAYDSLKFAAQMACHMLKLDITKMNVDWENLFKITRGTTEKNLIRAFCFLHNININQIPQFEERFYEARAVWFRNMKSFKENPYDIYYPDAENLINIVNHNNQTSLYLLTGNPRLVMEERLAKHLKNYFIDKKGNLQGVFGDETMTREELISKAILQEQKVNKNFKVMRDKLGFATNVYYFGDSRKDFFASLNTFVRSVWIPSRSLQEVKDIAGEDYIVFLKKMLGDRIHIVNRIDSEEIIDQIFS